MRFDAYRTHAREGMRESPGGEHLRRYVAFHGPDVVCILREVMDGFVRYGWFMNKSEVDCRVDKGAKGSDDDRCVPAS